MESIRRTFGHFFIGDRLLKIKDGHTLPADAALWPQQIVPSVPGSGSEPCIFMTSCGTRALHGLPHLSYSLSTRFLNPLFSPVVPAVVPLCKCTTYSLPFQWLSLLPLVSFFPLRARAVPARFESDESSTCTIWIRRDSLSLLILSYPHQNIIASVDKAFRAFLSED